MHSGRLCFLSLVLLLVNVVIGPTSVCAQESRPVVVLDMNMLILPGTLEYLESGLRVAKEQNAGLVVIKLNTPGGMLETTQTMIQSIFRSEVPVVVYVAPQGGTATSAGVFLTVAGHIAAMSPGTSIGSATPVQGSGQDIQGDMKKKAENMIVALVKSISDQRGRNVEWVEKAVRDANSITEKEALQQKVIDIIATDLPDLLRQIKDREVNVANNKLKIGDFSQSQIIAVEASLKTKVVNVLSNPAVVALLWLGATTGISIELYHPGGILPGVVGVICLVLALISSQIIPVSQGGVLLIIVGALLIGAELYLTSGILAVGGVISMLIGSLYLVDSSTLPGMQASMGYPIFFTLVMASLLLGAVFAAIRTSRRRVTTGREGLIGAAGLVLKGLNPSGKVRVNGEIWDAVSKSGEIDKDEIIEVLGVQNGLVLEVKKREE
ncbi:MAG: nodulation protein NfeD [SAR324 cluster bacterium]|uniref:Nodulation protein NfeD n=1 Tax=SAR324 cluster bacterium TaxID=2024889 RepID=A0A7X9FTL8_9DELT|nr:nodulation protein NfeD [SAR324 cluster bacterium]